MTHRMFTFSNSVSTTPHYRHRSLCGQIDARPEHAPFLVEVSPSECSECEIIYAREVAIFGTTPPAATDACKVFSYLRQYARYQRYASQLIPVSARSGNTVGQLDLSAGTVLFSVQP